MTDELAALLDDLVLALQDAKTNLCEALQELRHRQPRGYTSLQTGSSRLTSDRQ